jgi:hypothetical protein
MDEFKQKFVNVTRVAYCCAENSEVDGFEWEWVPLMNVAAFVEKVGFESGFSNVVFLVACDRGGTDVEVDFCSG